MADSSRAPGVAAAQEGKEIDLNQIARAWEELARRYDILVTEGAGGFYVPLIDTRFLIFDMVFWLGLPLIVVARPGLGTINHTVLTVKAAQQAGLPVAGVVINRYPAQPNLAEQTNPEVIASLTGVPILGKIPEIPHLDSAAGEKHTAANAIASPAPSAAVPGRQRSSRVKNCRAITG